MTKPDFMLIFLFPSALLYSFACNICSFLMQCDIWKPDASSLASLLRMAVSVQDPLGFGSTQNSGCFAPFL